MRIKFNTETKLYELERGRGNSWKVIDTGSDSFELSRKYRLKGYLYDGKYIWLSK